MPISPTAVPLSCAGSRGGEAPRGPRALPLRSVDPHPLTSGEGVFGFSQGLAAVFSIFYNETADGEVESDEGLGP